LNGRAGKSRCIAEISPPQLRASFSVFCTCRRCDRVGQEKARTAVTGLSKMLHDQRMAGLVTLRRTDKR
tara:strand:- start:351 stop:557 length:207 start_codon:yes stop_codon:yes gene_type:complete